MSAARVLCMVHAVSQQESEAKAPAKPKPMAESDPELAFYRKYTEALLRRYMRMSMQIGRTPSMIGVDVFRAKTSSHKVSSFEDAVIFVHDMEKCIKKLGGLEQKLLERLAMQEYTQEEAAPLFGMSPRSVVRRYGEALDQLTKILLKVKLLEPLKLY